MRKSCKTNDAAIVRRVSNTRTRFAIAPLLFLLTACRTPAPVETDTDANTDVDTDTVVEELACGPNTPPSCEEMIDGVCYGTEYPRPYETPHPPLTDDTIANRTVNDRPCGLSAVVSCVGGKYIGWMSISEEGQYVNGILSLYDERLIEATVVDAETRQRVAMGILPNPSGDAACERIWFGDRAAYPCFEELIDLLYEHYAGCTYDAEPCDYCGCRVNEVTDVQFPGCEVEDG